LLQTRLKQAEQVTNINTPATPTIYITLAKSLMLLLQHKKSRTGGGLRNEQSPELLQGFSDIN